MYDTAEEGDGDDADADDTAEEDDGDDADAAAATPDDADDPAPPGPEGPMAARCPECIRCKVDSSSEPGSGVDTVCVEYCSSHGWCGNTSAHWRDGGTYCGDCGEFQQLEAGEQAAAWKRLVAKGQVCCRSLI